MAHKKSSLNLVSGNKGIIFTLDVIVALFIVLFVMGVSLFFLNRSEESPIIKMQASRIASDITAVLDYSNKLSEVDTNKIKSEINSMIPEGYQIEFKIKCNNRVFDSREEIGKNEIFSGQRVFLDTKFNPCIMRYWIWLE